jgi:hypothetical protein
MKTLQTRIAPFLLILLVSLSGLSWPGGEGSSQTPGPKPPKLGSPIELEVILEVQP